MPKKLVERIAAARIGQPGRLPTRADPPRQRRPSMCSFTNSCASYEFGVSSWPRTYAVRGLGTAGRCCSAGADPLVKHRASRMDRRPCCGLWVFRGSLHALPPAAGRGSRAVCGGSVHDGQVQHQPASSQAMATLATTCRLPRSLNRAHRACRRRFPASPRARAAAEARSHRSRIVLPTTYRPLWCQAASTSSRRACPLPVLMIPPWTRYAPGDYSDGTRPT